MEEPWNLTSTELRDMEAATETHADELPVATPRRLDVCEAAGGRFFHVEPQRGGGL